MNDRRETEGNERGERVRKRGIGEENSEIYRDQMAEWLGNRATNQKVASLIPGRANDVVSLGRDPTFLGENVAVLTVSRSEKELLLND